MNQKGLLDFEELTQIQKVLSLRTIVIVIAFGVSQLKKCEANVNYVLVGYLWPSGAGFCLYTRRPSLEETSPAAARHSSEIYATKACQYVVSIFVVVSTFSCGLNTIHSLLNATEILTFPDDQTSRKNKFSCHNSILYSI